jgi:hypothetical protein
MPPDEVNPGSPEDWLSSAASDMILALIDPPLGVRLESFCFHAQQAAEKSMIGLNLLCCRVRVLEFADINSGMRKTRRPLVWDVLMMGRTRRGTLPMAN